MTKRIPAAVWGTISKNTGWHQWQEVSVVSVDCMLKSLPLALYVCACVYICMGVCVQITVIMLVVLCDFSNICWRFCKQYLVQAMRMRISLWVCMHVNMCWCASVVLVHYRLSICTQNLAVTTKVAAIFDFYLDSVSVLSLFVVCVCVGVCVMLCIYC